MSERTNRPRWALFVSAVGILFGLMTLKAGGEVLFVDGEGRAAAGNYVPFVLWFNFLAGFAYVIAGIGIAMWRPWAEPLSMMIAALTIAVFGAFAVHIWFGNAFETRTVGAMSFRSLIWLAIALTIRGRINLRPAPV